MSVQTMNQVRKLAQEATKAARVATRNRFLIETYLSFQEYKEGKVRRHKSVKDLFKKLGI